MDSELALKIKTDRENGVTYKEIAKKHRVSFSQISEVLKGEPRGEAADSEEFRRLAPLLLQLMRVSGMLTLESGVKSSILLHVGFNKHALNHGFETSTEYVEHTNSVMEEFQEQINHLEEVLDTWVWETDDELADLIGLHPTVKKLFHRAKLRASSREHVLVTWINTIILDYYGRLK